LSAAPDPAATERAATDAPEPATATAADDAPRWLRPNTKLLVALTVLALVSRLAWALWLHHPGDYVFSDMGQYILRANKLVEEGFVWGQRHLAWQSFGTHYVIALIFKLFGNQPPYTPAAVCYALFGAAAVPLSYLLACRVLPKAWMATTIGVTALLWYPNLANTGFFLSEAPFLAAQLLSTYWLVRVIQEGKRALPAGLISAICFMLRPQTAIWFVFVLAVWLINRRRLPWVRWTQIAAIAIPLVAALVFSMWRFHQHTGYWAGVAESANMNFTAGRCHNIVTQAFKSQAALNHSVNTRNTRNGRRVSVPGLRALGHLDRRHVLYLNPAMGHESIRFVGYIGDPEIHRGLRKVCLERTGVIGQLRYTLGNISLQWFFARQWPDQEPSSRWVLPVSDAYRYFFQIFVLIPSLFGMGVAIRRLRTRPELAIIGFQILGSIIIAGIFFGDIRLRTPYDPYALILALLGGAWIVDAIRTRRQARAAA
jgi:hypothetical protein